MRSRKSLQEPPREPLVEARTVTVRYGRKAVLDRVDLRVLPGQIVTLVGLNGSGKTTLVRALLGLVPVQGGRVRRRPDLRVGYAPQHIHRDPTLPLTVRRFLTLGAKASEPELHGALDEVGAEAIVDSQLADISGGELQRVLLARALLREPDLLVLDEPLAGVDIAAQTELYRVIGDVRERYGCGVLLVSHDLHVVMAQSDHVVCLHHHVCCTGRPETVSRHPEFVSLFGRRAAEVLALYTHEHDHAHNPAGHPIPVSGAESER